MKMIIGSGTNKKWWRTILLRKDTIYIQSGRYLLSIFVFSVYGISINSRHVGRQIRLYNKFLYNFDRFNICFTDQNTRFKIRDWPGEFKIERFIFSRISPIVNWITQEPFLFFIWRLCTFDYQIIKCVKNSKNSW